MRLLLLPVFCQACHGGPRFRHAALSLAREADCLKSPWPSSFPNCLRFTVGSLKFLRKTKRKLYASRPIVDDRAQVRKEVAAAIRWQLVPDHKMQRELLHFLQADVPICSRRQAKSRKLPLKDVWGEGDAAGLVELALPRESYCVRCWSGPPLEARQMIVELTGAKCPTV